MLSVCCHPPPPPHHSSQPAKLMARIPFLMTLLYHCAGCRPLWKATEPPRVPLGSNGFFMYSLVSSLHFSFSISLSESLFLKSLRGIFFHCQFSFCYYAPLSHDISVFQHSRFFSFSLVFVFYCLIPIFLWKYTKIFLFLRMLGKRCSEWRTMHYSWRLHWKVNRHAQLLAFSPMTQSWSVKSNTF